MSSGFGFGGFRFGSGLFSCAFGGDGRRRNSRFLGANSKTID